MSDMKKYDAKQFLIKLLGSSAALKCCSFGLVFHLFLI